jgi:transcription elongation factor GreA
MSNDVLLTKEGLEKLRTELQALKTTERSKVADAIKEAKSHGDLKENAAYHEAKLNQQRLDSRIADLENAIMRAKIVERPADQDDRAHLGSRVQLEDVEFGDEFTITLVGSFGADVTHNLISISSPLGEALLGKQVGDLVKVEAPGGNQEYRLLAVESIE